MKKLVAIILFILAVLCIAGICNRLHTLEAYYQASEKLLDRIYQDNQDYYLDILTETDEYEDYYNAVEALK